jgi:hypothetical protein
MMIRCFRVLGLITILFQGMGFSMNMGPMYRGKIGVDVNYCQVCTWQKHKRSESVLVCTCHGRNVAIPAPVLNRAEGGSTPSE